MTLSEELTWRGFANQTTLTDLKKLDSKKWTFYHGYDASADSITVGNLAALMMDRVFMRHGHKAVILAGGATSLIGDPGGKDTERPLQPEDKIEDNISAVRKEMERIFGHDVTMVNNLDWFKDMSVLEFLRDVGKHFSMTSLVQRDYIAKRIGEGGSGISYTEFSYTLLQGYDYLYLNQEYGVNLQLAGSDQWGNSISGVDLVRRVTGNEVHIVTCPLIINEATGKKFGKSEEGAVWLSSKRTSVYKFYQFWLNTTDVAVEKYLKIFTELDKLAIDKIILEFNKDKAARHAQKTLAYEVTRLVHGKDNADKVRRASSVLFGGDRFMDLSESEKSMLAHELPTTKVQVGLAATLVRAGLASSNTEATRFIKSGAISVNGEKIEDAEGKPFQKGKNLVKRGKNSFAIVDK